MVTPTPQTQSATRLNRLSAGATKHSAELQNLLLPNGTGPGSRTQGRTSTALTVATDDRPETTAGSKLSPARHPVPGDGRGPKLQTAGFMAVPFFNVGIIHLRVLPAPPDLFPPFTPAGKIQPQSLSWDPSPQIVTICGSALAMIRQPSRPWWTLITTRTSPTPISLTLRSTLSTGKQWWAMAVQ